MKFWMLYIELMHIFLRFGWAYRTNNLQLSIYPLGQMCPIFFAGNRPNNLRWMVCYYHNLKNMNNTHPGVRTNKSFSRFPVNITLEKTVNADAASRLIWIAALSKSDSTRQRWMITRAVRSCTVGSLLDKAGFKSKEDISKTLKPYRVIQDKKHFSKRNQNNTVNPFD